MPDAQREDVATEISLFDRRVQAGSRADLRRALLAAMAKDPVSAFFCNVHMLMLSREHPGLAQAMESADLVLPDGVPVAWLQRRLGHPSAQAFRGFEAMEAVCEQAAAKGRPIGLLGSTEAVLGDLKRHLEQRHRGLRIAYLHAPPEISGKITVDEERAGQINSGELYCLFVGLGCPKQELWAAAYRPHLNCSVLAVGAAFDWLAGTVRAPPKWMQDNGLGWLFRLLQDPGRMWYRYLKYNTKFIAGVSRILLFKRSAAAGDKAAGS